MQRQRKAIQKGSPQHSSCVNCGKLVFDRVLAKCPKCGGRITYFSDSDLDLLMRVSERPVLVAAEKED